MIAKLNNAYEHHLTQKMDMYVHLCEHVDMNSDDGYFSQHLELVGKSGVFASLSDISYRLLDAKET